jgi:3-oxoacyl-[acyl-carrier protein] reductase
MDARVNNTPVLDLRGLRAVVTGGSRGIGRSVAVLLAQGGAEVAISWRSRSDEAEATLRAIEAVAHPGTRAPLSVQGDLVEEGASAELFDAAEAAFGGVDLFIGNHGIWPPEDVPISAMSTERWRETLRVNLDSLFFSTREAARRITDHGRIVLVSSTAGQRGEAFHGDYAATKGGVISLVKGLAMELAPRGVTVNAVAPGWVDTEMSASALQGADRARAEAGIPLRRVATADDVAGPIVFLCSPLARHITAEVLNVNGGSVPIG